MSPEEFRKKKLIKDIVDNPYFLPAVDDIRDELALKMLHTEKEEDRQKLFSEAQALRSLIGRFTAIANEVRMINAA